MCHGCLFALFSRPFVPAGGGNDRPTFLQQRLPVTIRDFFEARVNRRRDLSRCFRPGRTVSPVEVVDEEGAAVDMENSPVSAWTHVEFALRFAAIERFFGPSEILDEPVDVVLVEASAHMQQLSADAAAVPCADARMANRMAPRAALASWHRGRAAQAGRASGSLLAQSFLDGGRAVADLAHDAPQFFFADAERLRPVRDFVLFGQADARPILRAAVSEIVCHGVLLW